MKLNKTKNYFYINLSKASSMVIFSIALITIKGELLNAEYLSEEYEIDTSTKTNEDSSVLPTNPFEIVEMIRRQNSLNEATKPSDAIDEALNSFNNMEEE